MSKAAKSSQAGARVQNPKGSHERVGRRAGRTGTIHASKWWAVEGREKGVWTSVIAGETSVKSAALMAVEDLRKTMPHMQWRVVEVVERRTVIRVTRASSPTAELRQPPADL